LNSKYSVSRWPERLLRLVATLEIELARDVHKARTILRQLVGNEIPVVPHASGKHLVARIGLDMTELLQAVGASVTDVLGKDMVAGDCFDTCLLQLPDPRFRV
jgi:hypothetical protein